MCQIFYVFVRDMEAEGMHGWQFLGMYTFSTLIYTSKEGWGYITGETWCLWGWLGLYFFAYKSEFCLCGLLFSANDRQYKHSIASDSGDGG